MKLRFHCVETKYKTKNMIMLIKIHNMITFPLCIEFAPFNKNGNAFLLIKIN